MAGAGDAEEDGQHDEAVVGGEENDEEENLESHANVINDSQVHQGAAHMTSARFLSQSSWFCYAIWRIPCSADIA